jgi:peptidoglycan hydrolase CwlO-like protein
MQRPISDTTKRAVIEEYLKGKNRDPIASDLGLATGTVSKIIREWKTHLDYPNVDELRELAVGLRKLGISASRYAQGARIASCLVEMGIDEEDFHQFVSGIYDSCKKMDLQPDKVVYLLKLLHDIPESISPKQFEEYIELQKSQINRSKEEIQRLEERIQNQKSSLDIALKEGGTIMDELKQFSSFKEVMKNNGVTMSDNLRFAEAVVGSKKLGFDPHIIVQKISNLMHLEIEQKGLEEKVNSLKEKVEALKQKCSDLEQEELAHNYSISIYRDLEKMGLGIKQLKLLLHTVTEIATANNVTKDKASEKFFSDVQKHYDDKLGFELELQNLRSEIQKSEGNLHELAAELNSTMLKQVDQIQQVSGIAEFLPLLKARSGLKVPKNELRVSVIKAIELLRSTVSTGRSTLDLINSIKFLRMEIEQNPTHNYE